MRWSEQEISALVARAAAARKVTAEIAVTLERAEARRIDDARKARARRRFYKKAAPHDATGRGQDRA